MPETLRSGAWLTRARRTTYAWIFLALSAVALVALVATSDGLVARDGKPLGTDFSNVYAAGRLVLKGEAPAAYDWDIQHAEEKAVFGREDIPFYGWHYPPFFLALAALLATMPYLLALFVWQATTFALYLRLAARIVPGRETLLLAAAFPAVFVNFGHGHNGFLTTALLAGALLVLDRRPILAGLLIGLLAYKPQFGLLIPLVLVATGRWQTFFAAATTVLAMAAIATAAFGIDVWPAFIASLEPTRTIVLEAGSTGWEKIQSIFAAVRMWGGTVPAAHAAQGVVTLLVAAALVWQWRRPVAFELKAAALCLASLLATPYTLDYDMVLVGGALAFLARHGLRTGFGPYEISLAAIAWTAPLIARQVATYTAIPIGALATLALFTLILLRTQRDARATQNPSPEIRHALA
ncbi:MAG: hypothetical protein C0606_14810 [Hyphomicrobiales bacterium]|nr:MAG: hypothetical protein C0606_14810 [Hyphomicrobiales bacterium]